MYAHARYNQNKSFKTHHPILFLHFPAPLQRRERWKEIFYSQKLSYNAGRTCKDKKNREARHARIKQAIHGLKQETGKIEREIDSIKQEIAGIKQEIDGIKQEIQKIKREIDRIKREIHGNNRKIRKTNHLFNLIKKKLFP
jgi:septal ring factor EnvC (AmiA/AmiB activator)